MPEDLKLLFFTKKSVVVGLENTKNSLRNINLVELVNSFCKGSNPKDNVKRVLLNEVVGFYE